MVLTHNHPHPRKSTSPDSSPRAPYKQNQFNQGQLNLMNSMEDENAATFTHGSERTRLIIERPRNLIPSNANSVIGRQKRSRSSGGRPPPHKIGSNRPRLMSQEVTEIILSPECEEATKLQPFTIFCRNSGVKIQDSSSTMTVSRGNCTGRNSRGSSNDSPIEVRAFVDMITRPVPTQRGKNNCWDATPEDMSGDITRAFVATPPTNPDHPSTPLRPRSRIKNSATLGKTYSNNSTSLDSRLSWKGNTTIRHRMRRVFARSTPDINMEVSQNNARNRRFMHHRERSYDQMVTPMLQVEMLMNRLKFFENGNLPKIPPELSDYFPQGLPRHDFTAIEKMWSHLTSNNNPDSCPGSITQCRKGNDQQLSAIMELLYTEACYIKTLEMIIDVHIAVYLDLTKSTTTASSYSQLYRGGSLSHLADPTIPSESAPPNTFTNGFITSSNPGGIIRRIRGRNGFEYTNASTIASSPSSLSSLSTTPHSDLLGFSAPSADDIFGNIGDVYRANHSFWTDCFEPEIVNEETLDSKYCIRRMQKAFTKFKEYFEPYVRFLESYNTLVSNIRYLNENNKFFSIYHEWTKSNNALNSRESLVGLLAQPFQRLTRYGILIKRIKESTVDDYEIAALTEMIDAVNDFVKRVDVNQPEQEARSKLNDFIHRIHKYTFADTIRSDFGVELSSVSAEIGSVLRQPMRINGRSLTRKPIADVQAKVKYIGGKVSDALCVLLSDMILICKQSLTKRHLSVCRPPIPLTHLTIQKKKEDFSSYIGLIRNDYGLLVDCYCFSSGEKDLEEWISKVLRQKTELLSNPHPISISRDSINGSTCLYSTKNSTDGSIYSLSSHMRQHEYGSRRNSDHVWKRPTIIGRPQQLLESAAGLLSAQTRRESITSNMGICKNVLTPDGENTPVDKQRSGFYNKAAVSKSTSSASDSSNTSNSTSSSVNILTTTSGDSFGGSARSGSLNGIPPKIVRHSLGREATRPFELLKTDSVAKRQTS